MEDIPIAQCVVRVDVERTRATYAEIDRGGWESCGCEGCRNFGAAVVSAFPGEVLEFFRRSGIDPLKDAEVYEQGESRPGLRSYGGEYYLWGEMVKDAIGELSEESRFRFTFTRPSPLAPDAFRHEGALCFLFEAELPWVGP